MLAAATLFTKLGTAVGAGAATAGSVGLTTALSLAGTAISGISAIQSSRYNAAVLARNAALEEENAKIVSEAGNRQAKEADLEAASIMADVISQQAASGFQLSSGSFVRRQQKNTSVAASNRIKIIEDAQRESASAKERAASLRAEGAGEKRKGFFSLISTGIGFGNDLISGANLAGDLKTRRTSRTTTLVGAP